MIRVTFLIVDGRIKVMADDLPPEIVKKLEELLGTSSNKPLSSELRLNFGLQCRLCG